MLQRNFFINFGTNGVVYFFQFLTTVVVSRLLTPAQVGVFAVSMAIVGILQGLREFGAVSYIVQERELTDEKVQSVFAIIIGVGWSFGLLLFFCRNWFAAYFGDSSIVAIISILSLSFIAFPFGLPATAMLRRERKFSALAIISTSASAVSFLVTCGMALQGYGAVSLAWGNLVGAIVQATVALYIWPQHLFLMPSLRAWRDVARYGFRASSASLVSRVGIASPELVIGKVLGLHDAAIFTRGRVLPLLVDRFTAAPFQLASTPEVASLIRQGQAFKPNLLRSSQAATIFGFWLLSFMLACAPAIIRVVYGPQWGEAAPVLRAVCVNQAILLLALPARICLEATGSVSAILRNEIAFAVLLVGFLLIGTRIDLPFTAWLLAVPSLLSVALYWRAAHHSVQINWLDLTKNLMFPLSLAFAVVFANVTFDFFGQFNVESLSFPALFAIMVGKGILSVMVGLIMLKANGHWLWDSIIGLLRKRVEMAN